MNENQTVLETLGGPRRVALLLAGLVFGGGFYHWLTSESGNAMREVGIELGLEYEEVSQRRKLRGRIDDIGVAVDTTAENRGGDTKWFTDFKLYAPDQPHGRIVGAGIRERLIGGMKKSEWLDTGDADFDKAVLIEGAPGDLLPRLNAGTRSAILAATDAGWTLEGVTWQVRKSGRMTSADKIRSLLKVGLEAAKAMRVVESARDVTEPVTGGSATAATVAEEERAGEPITPENAMEALDEYYTPRSLEAALFLAGKGDFREDVRTRLKTAILSRDRTDEIIKVLGEAGGPLEIPLLNSVTGEHEEAAKEAVAAIETRN
ncbi:hypothetical protein VSU19_18300 [Verrucomicrobiales bacterium BCK34]|nr:hypothetical protein [Verrucomicrobiales bacterium BCK34]